MFYIFGCWVLDKLHIDDPVEAAPVHLFGGIWGTLATGFFSNANGLFYDNPGKAYFFGVQVLGIVVILAWVSVTSFIVFFTMKKLHLLRVDKSVEMMGLDIAEMGGVPEEMYEKMRKDFGGSNYSPSHSFNKESQNLQSLYKTVDPKDD